ncbi:MAG: hypothetical protein NVS9B1_11670 [Candidatus Dormibacteraceae bacterium]
MIHLGHGAAGSAASMHPHVAGLIARGIPATAVELPKGSAERAMPVFLAQSGSGPQVALGGHSFGGRVASLLAAGHVFRALVLFSYPLHRPGHPDELRVGHWAAIGCPVLLLCGERDMFARLDLLRAEVARRPNFELVTFPGAGHGLKGADLETALDRAADFLR